MDDDEDFFLPEDDTPAEDGAAAEPPWVVLIVDDDPDVHVVTRAVIGDLRFQGRTMEVLNRYSGAEARVLMAERPDVAVMLLDVVMETDDAGLQVVRHVREHLRNSKVRIVLRTGQPGQAPEQEVIVDYDINDYKSKTELTAQKLFTTLIAALRSYNDLVALEASRDGMKRITDASAELFGLRVPQDFADQALAELACFVGTDRGALFCRDASAQVGGVRLLALRDWKIDEEASVLAEVQLVAESGHSVFERDRILLRQATPNGRELFAYLPAPQRLDPLRREQLELFASKMAIGYDNVVMHDWLSQTNRWLEEQVSERTRELSEKTTRLEVAQRRMAEELKLASVLQQSILPHDFPADEALHVTAAMVPANQVGGDFYHLIATGPDETAFLIADVSGKGVPAAFFMLRSHGLLHEIAARGVGPAACLLEANRRLCEGNPLTLFVTLFFGVLNTRTRVLRYANAGHDLPLLLRADGTISELRRPGGTLLGIIEEAAFVEAEIQLAPGDRLFLFTDGITEAMNPGGALFGAERLNASLLAAHGAGVDEMMRRVMRDVEEFAGGAAQSDDITCMLLGVGGG